MGWLESEIGSGTMAPPVMGARKSLKLPESFRNDLPGPYQKVLEQIEMHGWHSMNWRDDFTMLHWAAMKGHTELVKYLIHLDADVLAVDSQGRTPTNMARDQGHHELVSVLQGLSGRRSSDLSIVRKNSFGPASSIMSSSSTQ